jgi:uncharacterized protein YndB with AHSA1/START domain
VSEPLHLSVDLNCPAEHAFRVWTTKLSQWWPADHTVTGAADLEIVLEGRIGGLIFERTPSGVVHEWGEITGWDPPRRLSYHWYLRQDRADATEVEITFVDRGDATTRVEIEHRGWERLGAKGPDRKQANTAGWRGLLPHFVAACHEDLDY